MSQQNTTTAIETTAVVVESDEQQLGYKEGLVTGAVIGVYGTLFVKLVLDCRKAANELAELEDLAEQYKEAQDNEEQETSTPWSRLWKTADNTEEQPEPENDNVVEISWWQKKFGKGA